MAQTVHVNLHMHTSHSDGALSPAALARRLAAAGVRFAALCDHDTVEGWPAFRAALDEQGIPALPGIELTTVHEGRLLHLLAYAFDPAHPELRSTLGSVRERRSADAHSLEASLRAARDHAAADAAALSAAPDGQLEVGAAIALLHRAGGHAFLAHPLVYERDLGELEALVLGLKEKGLDGIEAIYDEFSADERAALRALAQKHDLLVCAGTDYHGVKGLGSPALGIDMPTDDWDRFRAAMLDGHGLGPERDEPRDGRTPPSSAEPVRGPVGFSRRPFILRVVLPAVAVMALFLIALWGVLLPSFEQTLVDRKREMIRELTNAAWSVLSAYHADELSGALSREEAQAAAAAVVSELRYGEDRLDYFWIQDTSPRMVRHPYRPDLDGEDLSGFTDARGVPIFVEFAELVKAEDEGYVDYVWQWFDDPERLEPKQSYVKGFEPWGWVIGTGLYVDDVRAEIGRIERDLIIAALGISGLMALLLLLVLQQSLRIERRREEGVGRLRDSNARYQALAEATSEGTLLVVEDRLRYANPTFLQLLGYTSRQLEFLEIDDVLPRGRANRELWGALESGEPASPLMGVARDGLLTRSDGSSLECLLTLEPVEFGGQAGSILLARDVTASAVPPLDTSALGSSVGVFRALAARRAVFLELSPAGRDLLSLTAVEQGSQLALADCFADAAEFGRVYRRLVEAGEVRDHVLTIDTAAGARSVLLSAALVRDEEGRPAWIDGLLVDITAARGQAADREIQGLRASMLFLHDTIEDLAQMAVVIPMGMGLDAAAARMTSAGATAALVASGSGSAIGIITDHDIRARVVAEGSDPGSAVETIMTAPLMRVSAGAPVYEALSRMEQGSVRHLVVEDTVGVIVGIVDKDALIRSPRYAPLVILRDIAGAETADEVARRSERRVSLAAGLVGSSARPRHVNSMLTSIFDAVSTRLIELALSELGPAPMPFAFIAFGSEGRGEVHLTSDQDHGIIYGAPADARAADADADAAADARAADTAAGDESGTWFRQLGETISAGLEAAGYPRCRGLVMAGEAGWCRSLPGWKARYDEWLRRTEPQDITDLSVFLDFRLVHGEAGLVREMRKHVHSTLPDRRGVQSLLARNALAFRPPLRLPGNIYLGGAAESAGRFDLKDALQPMVAFARVYGERQRIAATHTMERIAGLAERDLLPAGSLAQIGDAYDFLMGLRLQSQLEDARAGREPTGVVELSGLTSIQRELLRQAFAAIAEVQKTAEREFPEV